LATGGIAFAVRADAYRLPGLRVDGNDFLAVHAAEMWAIERARRGGGPTLVELVTYRRDAHSTSDDPAQYRPADEADSWPGGDPIERLKRHLIGIGEWSEESHRDLDAGLEREAAATFQQAEAFGSHTQGLGHAPESLFDDVYAVLPPHLRSQLSELNAMPREDVDEGAILPFKDRKQRAAG
jgi:2-oxoisovalerate dehydrogenase E1 component alpha subunit